MKQQPTEWPPPVITEWVRGGTVNTDNLAVELRAWAAWAEPCGHEYWDIREGGRTFCRECGIETTDMEAMGS